MSADRDFALMQDFILGHMSDEECRAFEERLVREPALVRDLEQSLRMSAGLERLRSDGYLSKTEPRRRNIRPWVPALLAATVAGVALIPWLLRDAGQSSLLVSAADGGQPVASQFTFVSMRGSAPPTLNLPNSGRVEFRVAPSNHSAAGRYHVTLVREDAAGTASTVGNLADVAASADGYVHAFAEASHLSRGRYLLRIEPTPQFADAADVFPFTLQASTGSAP
jgi:hypothetical protein